MGLGIEIDKADAFAKLREGRAPKTRPPLVLVGWSSLALTIAVPILGAILADLA